MKRSALIRKTPLHSRAEVTPRASKEAKEDAPRKPNPRKCDWCGKEFTPHPSRPLANICKPKCALERAKAKERAEKEQGRAQKEALKRLPDLHREAQKAVNTWIRLRDSHQPCISCGAPPPDLSGLHAGRDAGHYRSIGSAPQLRYNEDNIHAQCVHCNQWGAGKAVEYRAGLIARLGWARVHALECENAPHKWQADELRRIRDGYRARVRALKAQREEA